MISKIKELMQIKELISQIGEKLKEQDEKISKNSNSLVKLEEGIESIKDKNLDFRDEIKKETEEIRLLKDKLNDELVNFRLFKNESRKIFQSQMEREFSQIKSEMKKNVDDVNELKTKLDTKLKNIEKLESEITKLIDITKNLDAKDFSLQKYHKTIEKNEKEKYELRKEIDRLQKIIGKRRRG
ncbi:MAG: coiled-coil domain-containing protein [Nanoarchaeota archaeon]